MILKLYVQQNMYMFYLCGFLEERTQNFEALQSIEKNRFLRDENCQPNAIGSQRVNLTKLK